MYKDSSMLDQKISAHAPLFENLGDILTYNQLSSWIGLSKSTLEKYVHRREIPIIRISAKTIRFNAEDIRNWLRSKKEGVKNA